MSENALKPCPGCNGNVITIGYVGQPATAYMRVCQDCGWAGPIRPTVDEATEAWNTRPTPSSALTKALEEYLEHMSMDCYSEEVNGKCVCGLDDLKQALRASHGGEEIEREDLDALALCNKLMEKCHQSPLFEIAVRHTIIRLLQQRTECIEKGRMEGFKYGCEISGTWPESEKDQQDICFVAKTQMSAAIVSSHKSTAPEKEGRHDTA